MRTVTVLLLALLVSLAGSARADAAMTKRDARAAGLEFVTPFVDLLDVDRTVGPIMEKARDCKRLRHGRVRCQFKTYMHDGREIQSWVTIRRQPDGLYGFDMHLDVLKQGV